MATGSAGAAGVGITNRDQAHGAAYAVTLPVFEGPLDLLLHLIEKEELDISEVSLVAVTDQYLQTLEQLEEIQPGALADFLVVASRLLYIKSARLLPKPAARAGGEEEEESSDSLIRHLLEYRQFKRVAGDLRTREDAGLRAFGRTPGVVDLGAQYVRPLDLDGLELAGLHAALRHALRRMPVDPPQPKVHPYTVTVAEQIEMVRRVVAGQQAQVRFADLLGGSASRLEVLVTFLAVLELIKQRELHATQEMTFGEILLTPAEGDPAPATSPDSEAAANDRVEPSSDAV